MNNLVTINEGEVREFSGSLYVLLPKGAGLDVKKGDKAILLRAPGNSDLVIRIEKPSDSNVS